MASSCGSRRTAATARRSGRDCNASGPATPREPGVTDDDQTIERVATWLERCCRTGSLYERAEIAATLRLGTWREMPERRTAARDAAGARAHAEAFVKAEVDRQRRIRSAREAAAAGVEPLYDGLGRPGRHASRNSYATAAPLLGAFGIGASNPSAVTIYEYPPDGSVELYDGLGRLRDRWPNGRPPRQNTRLAGHAFRTVRCLRCESGDPGHPGCECGAWDSPDRHGAWQSKAEGRRWHDAHKAEVRNDVEQRDAR